MRPLHVVSTVDAVTVDLRARILDGEFGPGDALRELPLASEYGVARNTVRAVLMTLSHDALVVLERNYGARVPVLDYDDVRELYLIRELIEPGVAAIVAGTSPPDLADVRSALEIMSSFTDTTSWNEVVRADIALHRAIVGAAGSARLTRLFTTVVSEMELMLAQLRGHYRSPRELATEHHQLVDALASGDAERASAEMRRHLRRGADDLTPGPTTARSDR